MNQVIESISTIDRKGELLEEILIRVLKDVGFAEVQRQQSGSQFGFDVVAVLNPHDIRSKEIWKFECKNLSNPLKISDIAPKLIWYAGRFTFDRFVIVSTTSLGNEARHLLEEHGLPMPIEVWTEQHLESRILNSPSAMDLLHELQVPLPDDIPSVNSAPVFAGQSYVSFDVVHQMDPPHEFTYSQFNSEIRKSYTSLEFRLIGNIVNRTRYPLEVVSLQVHTNAFGLPAGRVLTLAKPKGLYRPAQLTFIPSSTPGGLREILKDEFWRIEPRSTDAVEIVLGEIEKPGVYDFHFEAHGISGDREGLFSSPRINLYAGPIDGANHLRLNVVGRHYDTAVRHVFDLPEDKWRRIVKRSDSGNEQLFLGPTPPETTGGFCDKTWKIKSVRVSRNRDDISIMEFNQTPTTVIDLGISIEEEIYSTNHALERVLNTDPWQKFVVFQIDRRLNRPY